MDDDYLYDTSFVYDMMNSIDNSRRNACVAKLNKNIQMLKGLSYEIPKIIKHKYVSTTPWDSDIDISI